MNSLLLALAISASATSAVDDGVVAKAEYPPWFPAIELRKERCPLGSEGRRVLAMHAKEGGIKGCWIRAMGRVFVIWDDDDATIWKEDVFFKPTL